MSYRQIGYFFFILVVRKIWRSTYFATNVTNYTDSQVKIKMLLRRLLMLANFLLMHLPRYELVADRIE